MYKLHPSIKLQQLFIAKPYQGIDPCEAKYLFIGLDANYQENIEEQVLFPKICEYHHDSVHFWKKHNVHHPFMLPNYKGDGKLYHQSFAKIGFTTESADKISFVELLHLPTTGRNQIKRADLNLNHLEFINSAILSGTSKSIFLSSSVLNLMASTQCFKWAKPIRSNQSGLSLLFRNANVSVYLHLHFSSYGIFQERKNLEIIEIAKIAGLNI